MGTLEGLTVMVTRPRAQAAGLASGLRARGARTILAPAIRTAPPRTWRPLDRALRRLGSYDAVAFTSANGVERFFDRAGAVLGRRPRRPAEVFAIGPGTAEALRRRGWRGAGLPSAYEGAALARRFGRVRGKRVLIPRADAARKVLPAMLRRAGARVSVVPAYRTVADPGGLKRIRAAAKRGEADWVSFTSASTVRHFVGALGAARARRFFRRARAASIGPVTSAALRAHGIEPAAEAGRYTSSGLVDAICARTRRRAPATLRRTLIKALREAGATLRSRFGKVRVRYKGRANLITAADHASEQRILDVILSRFPDHDFLTEERAPRARGSDYVWVIDPIDGTTNYAHGFPVCCVSIALMHRGRPLMAGILDPFRDEMFLARRGHGATLNGRRIRVSRARKLSESLLLTGFAYDRHKLARFYLDFYREFMQRSHDVRRSGSAALDLAWTAAGRVDGYWEFHLNPWDVAAGMLLVEEAGGKVSDFSGRPWSGLDRFGAQTLATNGLIHGPMLRIIRRNMGVKR